MQCVSTIGYSKQRTDTRTQAAAQSAGTQDRVDGAVATARMNTALVLAAVGLVLAQIASC